MGHLGREIRSDCRLTFGGFGTQGGGRLNLASVANAMNEGMGGGEAPFRVQFKSPPSLSQPNMPVLQLREVSFRWPGREIVMLSRFELW